MHICISEMYIQQNDERQQNKNEKKNISNDNAKYDNHKNN